MAMMHSQNQLLRALHIIARLRHEALRKRRKIHASIRDARGGHETRATKRASSALAQAPGAPGPCERKGEAPKIRVTHDAPPDEGDDWVRVPSQVIYIVHATDK